MKIYLATDHAGFEMKPEKEMTINVGIFNATGEEVQEVFKNRRLQAKKGYRFNVDFLAEGAQKGNYFIRVSSNGEVIEERTFVVE